MRHLGIRSGLLMVASAAPASPQTLIVDANSGPGTDYTSLATAIAAAPDGAVLRVRSGDYDSLYTVLSFANKSLSIVGDSHAVRLVSELHIGPLRAEDRVLIANVTIAAGREPYLAVRNAAGVVVIKDVVRPGGFAALCSAIPPFEFTSCANVQIADSRLTGPVRFTSSDAQASHSTFAGQGSFVSPSPPVCPAWPGIEQIAGRLHLTACTVTGGNGNLLVLCGFPRDLPATPAASAIKVAGGGELTLFGGSAAGGDGGPARAPCSTAKHGGHGLEVSSSRALIVGAMLSGGAGGSGGSGGGSPGLPLLKDTSSTAVIENTEPPPIAGIEGAVIAGNQVQLALAAKPASVSLLLLGMDTTYYSLPPIGIGNLYCLPAIVLGQFAVPSTGTLRIPITIPKDWIRDVPAYAQFVTLQSSPLVLWTSNPLVLLVRS